MTKFQIPVFSELYGETECCIQDIEHALDGGFSPCGDGCDYKLTHHEIDQLKSRIDLETFIPSSKLDYPLNLVALMQVDGNSLKIPQHFRFDKKQYQNVKTVMEKAGGTYSKNAFLFKENSLDVYLRIINGENYNLKKQFQFFATPPELAARLVELAGIQQGDNVLEPSAGQGAIIKAIYEAFPRQMEGSNDYPGVTVDYFELMELNRKMIEQNIFATRNWHNRSSCMGEDFLQSDSTKWTYKRIVANPPFNKNQDIDHIRQMYAHLKPGGRIVTIASNHWMYSGNKKEQEFKDWLGEIDAEIIDLPAGTFKESGTMIAACIIIIDK